MRLFFHSLSCYCIRKARFEQSQNSALVPTVQQHEVNDRIKKASSLLGGFFESWMMYVVISPDCMPLLPPYSGDDYSFRVYRLDARRPGVGHPTDLLFYQSSTVKRTTDDHDALLVIDAYYLRRRLIAFRLHWLSLLATVLACLA